MVLNITSVSKGCVERVTGSLVLQLERSRRLGLLGFSPRNPATGFRFPTRLRSSKTRIGVVRSPFVYKKSGEAFLLVCYKCKLVIALSPPSLGRLRLLLRSLPLRGVEITFSFFDKTDAATFVPLSRVKIPASVEATS